MKINFKRVLILGLILGLSLLLVEYIFKIDGQTLMAYYWKIALALLILIIIINTGYFLFYSKKLKEALGLFYAGKTKEYISAMERLLSKAKGGHLKNILKLNLAAGYLEDKSYTKAKDTLDQIDLDRLKNSDLKVVYYINLAICYFKAEDFESFKEIYGEEKELFEKYADHKSYGQSLSEIKIMAYLVDKDFDTAKNLLSETREKYTDQRFQESYADLEKLIKKYRE